MKGISNGGSNGGLSKNSNLNNILIILGGTSLAFLAYTYFKNQRGGGGGIIIASKPKQPVVRIGNPVRKNGNIHPLKLSMMSRSFNTDDDDDTTSPDTAAIKKKLLSMILNNAQNISSVIGNMDTVNAKIETYTAQLQLVLQQKALGVLTQYQVDQYIRQLVIDLASALQIQLVPWFTGGGTTGGGSGGTNEDGSTGIPGYYNDYMSYLNELYKRYYEYYQPPVQYYPGQQYNHYQPYSYQYPYPYYPSNVYPGSSSQGFSQGYYPQLQSQFPNQYGYGYGQQSPTGQYYHQQNPYGQQYYGGQQYQDPYAYLYGQGQQQGGYF